MKAAACATLLVGGLWLIQNELTKNEPTFAHQATPSEGVDIRVAKGLDWLIQVQEPSGEWDGAKWGGTKQFTTGLTGLALLALASSEDHRLGENRYREEIHKAIEFLTASQNHAGVFGGDIPGTRYNPAIATCALLEVYKSHPSTDLKRSLDIALQVILQEFDTPVFEPYASNLQPGHSHENSWVWMAVNQAVASDWNGLKERIPSSGIGSFQIPINPAGGRVYSTAMATLNRTLDPENPGS